jgi:signal transduction histidine kinase
MRGMLGIFLLVLLFTSYAVYSEYSKFDKEAAQIRVNYIKEQKESIVFDVNRVLKFITNEYYVRKLAVDSGLLKRQIANAISQLYGRPDQTGYIFIYSYKGVCLSDPVQPHNIGKNLYTYKDPHGVQVIKDLIDISKRDDGGFVEYTWVKPTTKERSPKISYAKAFEPWQWMVGTGVYLDEADKVISAKREALKQKLSAYFWKIVGLMVLLFVIGLAGVKLINYIIRQEITSFNHFFSRASKEHILIDAKDVKFKEFKKMVTYINSMVGEIHHRKEKLKELNKSLEKKVSKKTQNLLEQNQLLAKEKGFSEALVQAQDSFIKRSIHEMNTPLAVIMTHIDIYHMKHGENRYMSHIEAGAKMIATLYDDLSYMVKKNRFDYTKEWIDLPAFLLERTRFFQEIALGNRHQIITNIAEEIHLYFSDIELQRVIDNNLSNAIKYAKRSTDIYVKLYRDGEMIVLTFRTHSPKIVDTQKIFEPFHREESRVEGFGLGLEIVKSICDASNVDVEVSSNEEQTIFKYYFKGEMDACITSRG